MYLLGVHLGSFDHLPHDLRHARKYCERVGSDPGSVEVTMSCEQSIRQAQFERGLAQAGAPPTRPDMAPVWRNMNSIGLSNPCRRLCPESDDVLLGFLDHVPPTNGVLEPDIAKFDVFVRSHLEKILLEENKFVAFILRETQSLCVLTKKCAGPMAVSIVTTPHSENHWSSSCIDDRNRHSRRVSFPVREVLTLRHKARPILKESECRQGQTRDCNNKRDCRDDVTEIHGSSILKLTSLPSTNSRRQAWPLPQSFQGLFSRACLSTLAVET
jgi:hypothetical protein